MFLTLKLKRIWGFRHLRYSISLKDLKNLEKCLYAKDKVKKPCPIRKEERGRSICHQFKSQHQLCTWHGCPIWEGAINAKECRQILEQHMVPFEQHLPEKTFPFMPSYHVMLHTHLHNRRPCFNIKTALICGILPYLYFEH